MKRIPLTQGQFALVGDADFAMFGHLNWCASWEDCTKSFVAKRRRSKAEGGGIVRLHREILGVSDPLVLVDHKNHDTLDCRRRNLRSCTSRQNQRNRNAAARHSQSRLRGVVWNKECGKWAAYIKVNGKSKYLGVHLTAEIASRAYWRANKKYFGDFGGRR